MSAPPVDDAANAAATIEVRGLSGFQLHQWLNRHFPG